MNQAMLSAAAAATVTTLQHEIAVLREARDCVTDSCTPAVIYGRVDDLINQRQDAVLRIVKSAREVEIEQVHLRG